jgi:integral membrane protein
MWGTPLGRLRLTGIVEGISFLILLFIAMSLKYFADFPEPVTIVGMIHGVLFTVYLLAIAHALIVRQISFILAVLAVAAAFLPFGPFILERKLRK